MSRAILKSILILTALLIALAGLSPRPAAAQENSLCGLLLGDSWNTVLAISPTWSIVIRPMDLDDMLELDKVPLETTIRIYDPVFTSGNSMNGVIEGFSRLEVVSNCEAAQPTATPPPARLPTRTPTAKPVATSYGCNNSAEKAPECGCGVYAALQSLGGTVTSRLGKSYFKAALMADQAYWNEGYLQYPQNTVWRYQTDFALAEDVLILQPGAEFRVLQANGQPGPLQKTVDFGHAGIIRSASHVSKTIDKKPVPGWEVTLRSANWGCYTGNKTFTDGTCANVSDVKIFVPDSSAASFWHRVSAPRFASLYSTAGQQVLKPVKNEAGSLIQGTAETSLQISKLYTQQVYNRFTTQAWALVQLPQTDPYLKTNYYRIVSLNSGKCLDVSGGSSQNGTSVILWDCHSGDNQKWLLIPQYGGYQIQSKSSGKLLTFISQQSPSLVIWEASGGNTQLWTIKDLNPK